MASSPGDVDAVMLLQVGGPGHCHQWKLARTAICRRYERRTRSRARVRRSSRRSVIHVRATYRRRTPTAAAAADLPILAHEGNTSGAMWLRPAAQRGVHAQQPCGVLTACRPQGKQHGVSLQDAARAAVGLALDRQVQYHIGVSPCCAQARLHLRQALTAAAVLTRPARAYADRLPSEGAPAGWKTISEGRWRGAHC